MFFKELAHLFAGMIACSILHQKDRLAGFLQYLQQKGLVTLAVEFAFKPLI
jgi:hypothetical protein